MTMKIYHKLSKMRKFDTKIVCSDDLHDMIKPCTSIIRKFEFYHDILFKTFKELDKLLRKNNLLTYHIIYGIISYNVCDFI